MHNCLPAVIGICAFSDFLLSIGFVVMGSATANRSPRIKRCVAACLQWGLVHVTSLVLDKMCLAAVQILLGPTQEHMTTCSDPRFNNA